MKRSWLWGFGLMAAVGLLGYLLSIQESGATSGHTGGLGKLQGSNFNPNNVGSARDSQADDLRDVPGADRNQDRTIDSDPDRDEDSVPDCQNGPGDGGDSDQGCFNSPFGGEGSDGKKDYFGPDDGNSDNEPDALLYAPINNRVHDEARGGGTGDVKPEQTESDRNPSALNGSDPGDNDPDRTVFDNVADAVGSDAAGIDGDRNGGEGDSTRDRWANRDETPDDTGEDGTRDHNPDKGGQDRATDDRNRDGISDRTFSDRSGDDTGDCCSNPDRVNRDSSPDAANPDRGANPDATADGTQDRVVSGDSRERGIFNPDQASMDVVAASFGPGDKLRDQAADQGGLATTVGGGGGGGGGCSFSPSAQADSSQAMGLLLILLLPLAIVGLRRRIQR